MGLLRQIVWVTLLTAVAVGTGAQPTDSLSWDIDLVSDGEPGDRLVVTGTVRGSDGAPRPATPVHVFQADAEGYYSKGSDGDDRGWRHARLSGWLRTREDGSYRVRTIRPGGYPDRPTPAHIHFRVLTPDRGDVELSLFFEDDPRLTPQIRQEISGSGHVFFRRVERDSSGVWRCTNDMRLPR